MRLGSCAQRPIFCVGWRLFDQDVDSEETNQESVF